MLLLANEVLVVVMRANPVPDVGVAVHNVNRSVLPRDGDRVAAGTVLTLIVVGERSVAQGRVVRVGEEQAKRLLGQPLNSGWQTCKQFLELACTAVSNR
jgi:hypothetical protein